ncbi:tyrosine-type recombinase/integrase [Thiomicrorhabdus sp. 6S2-11]|uniref:Tyrosine-type recombinase/integrase n=1 Tax=Thiomicrorhabdus marina TaxID=2818442 RepID=A0ABS3Q498_9GAMM|nr:tyrosine-type recombinase/integrase [Thiomicrorhabdus marina]MBO1927111.1 tyrosine-type recombinase/integrase [Thiomicrorhabdus marina]
MPLTDVQVKNLKAKENAYKQSDKDGLYIHVSKTGHKSWRRDYRFNGKRQTITIGVYPILSLKEARLKNSELTALLHNKVDPKESKEKAKPKPTFKDVALEFMDKQLKGKKWTPGTFEKNSQKMEKNLFPFVSNKPIGDISPLEFLEALQPMEDRGVHATVKKVRGIAVQIFDYAILKGLCTTNPARGIAKALTPHKEHHYKTLTDTRDIAKLMQAINGYKGDFKTVVLLKLAPLTLTRPTELRSAKWDEFNFSAKEWRIPASKMKSRREHIVPLSKQALKLLQELQLVSGHREYLFFSNTAKTGFLSENTASKALHSLGFKGKMTVHGFRGMTSTRLNEMGWPSDVIERQLSHLEGNKTRAAYNHAEYLDQRREMMQEWADELDRITAREE